MAPIVLKLPDDCRGRFPGSPMRGGLEALIGGGRDARGN